MAVQQPQQPQQQQQQQQQQQLQSVEADWDELSLDYTSRAELKVPVSLFIMCKTVVEDDQGALFLNGTLVQRILVGNIPEARRGPATAQDNISIDDQNKLKALLFPISIKGPIPGDPAKSRRVDLVDLPVPGYGVGGPAAAPPGAPAAAAPGTTPARITKMCSETLDLVHAPLDIRQHWYIFPFRILEGTVDLELQAKYRPPEFGSGKVLLCPDLLCPTFSGNPPTLSKDHLKQIIRVKRTGRLSRLRRLAFIRELPVVEVCYDVRLRKDAAGRAPNDRMFTRHPQLRLKFWMYEPISKAIFKIVGPLVLVLTLMLLNFEEFFGFDAVYRKECEEATGSEAYESYLANGIGIALAAFFVVPSIRAETTKSPGISFTWDDFIAVIFLAGLALSNAPQCYWAFAGCVLCSLVVLIAVVSLVCHEIKRKNIRWTADRNPLNVLHPSDEEKKKTKPRAVEFDKTKWTRI